MTKTIAGRHGAIAGFGLSVVKWSLIIKVCAEAAGLQTKAVEVWFKL